MVCVTRHMGVKSTLDDLTKLEAVYVQPRMAGRQKHQGLGHRHIQEWPSALPFGRS